MAVEHQSDEHLLRMIAHRDVHALELLYDRHAQIVYNLIMRIVRESALADELLQDTFWQIWQKADTFQANGAPAAWMYRIARNKSLDELRRQQTRPQPTLTLVDASEQQLPAMATSATTVEDSAEYAFTRLHLRRALGDIPLEQRQCLELAYFEGMSQREIATFMDTPLGTVKTRMRIGLEKLARILRSAGWEAEDR